ncbi:hypothetical protein J8TS2_05910 [Lederbergia ruris]|uniref:Uncharacterized protein n=1 Tax=Lederbergia ruris TaxID=217495 RepID=A0ABQ4KEF4_9BACI|nr:hypothetical protein J8TS2_05910 [Lederbergia ruris]
MFTQGHHSIKSVLPTDIRSFIVDMFDYRQKSMGYVVTVLRKLHTYFRAEGLLEIRF